MTRQKRVRERAEAEARAEAVEEDDMRRFRAAPPPPGPWQAPALTSLRFLMSAQAFLMIMLMLLVVAIVSSEMDAADRAPDRSRQRLDMQKHIGAMTERDFARYYRVDRQSFADIVEMITPPLPELRKRRKRARKSSGGFVEFDLRLSMALRYLAGGSYLDIMYLHGVSRSTCYKHIFGTLKAMDMALPEFTLDEDIHSLERCRALTATFAAKTDEYIQGAIAAWDGIIFKVEKPTQLNKSKVPNPNKFHCRKGYPGVSVQAACDGNRRFLYMAMDFAASCHDARAFRGCKTRRGSLLHLELEHSKVLGREDAEHLHPFGFFILADDAYPCRGANRIVCPWTTTRDRWWRDAFKYHQSRGRINIECAFGMLVRKFLVLARPMGMDLDKCRKTVRVAMKLHNLCIDRQCLGPAALESGVLVSDFTGRYETQWATARAAHIAAKRQNAGVGNDGDDGAREVASLTLDLTSGTPGDSPEPNWEPDDAPDDLVPNRTDLEGGPRHGLTEWLKGARVHRPDPREAARRIDRNRYGD